MRSLTQAGIAAALLTCVAAAPAAAQSDDKKTPDPNEMICEKQRELGSRLAVKRVCMTRAQWAQQRLTQRQDVEKAQTYRPMRGN